MKYYEDLDGFKHFIGSRPYSDYYLEFILEGTAELLRSGLKMDELTTHLINTKQAIRQGICNESIASSIINQLFKYGVVRWGEGNRIFLNNW